MSAPGNSTRIASDADNASEPEPPERPHSDLHVNIVEEAGDWSAFGAVHDRIRRAASALARDPGCDKARGAEAGVVLGSDALVQRLNGAYRGKDAPTNVLSFPYQEPPGAEEVDGGAPYLGDVVLAAETIRREAAERGIEPEAHLQHLVVHGLLHLLGYDHLTDAQAEEMESVEVRILSAVGVADPYAAYSA
ncbi:MAG: rRNA maturation RNase YbeY [Hyphomicrobiaceae bacterium]|nr:MAG: rRNA maturation RNase YbeY [Hyphomicrobiaceae bacterium]